MKKIIKFKQKMAIILIIIMFITNSGVNEIAVKADNLKEYVTLYLIDNTPEKWIKNDNAQMQLIDNTNGHDCYNMTKIDDIIWSVSVPATAYNITFNRISPDKSIQWNSWSAGGRDDNNAYYVDGSEYGHWENYTDNKENYFHAGDIIYLDLSEFKDWKNDGAIMYINFSDASKKENTDKDIVLKNSDKELYNPILIKNQITKDIFMYIVTNEDEGAVNLRFWRGNETILWNCSICLSIEEYKKGNDCIKINGWDENSILVKTGLTQADSDGDGLSNVIENKIGTNIYDVDSDGDGLDDAYEYYYLMTDPTKKDSDNNGISDYYEDFDGDGLINGLEYINGTDPYKKDSDEDGLSDYDEIYIYKTNALKSDSDEDGLSDMEDIEFGFDPMLPDTDYNGILDGDEKRNQIKEIEINNVENTQVKKISVEMKIGGNIEKKVEIKNVYGDDLLSSNIVGLIGVPVDIKLNEEFEEATLTFYYDKNKLGNTKESDLAVLWYDEENDWYTILDKESVVDTEKGTVSYKTTHFSTYMLVDKKVWYNTWRENLNYRNGNIVYDFSFVIDCSGSMEGNRIFDATAAMLGFVKSMSEDDEANIITFNSSAKVEQEFTDKHTIINKYSNLFGGGFNTSGGTNVNNALTLAINQYEKRQNEKKHIIILICDGDVNYNQNTIDIAIKNNIVIYTINVGYRTSGEYLKKIANQTGGEYYYCENSNDIETMIASIQSNTIYEVDTKDTDKDGLYDIYETVGFRLLNGTILKSDPLKSDTDGDGLSDYEEIGIVYNIKLKNSILDLFNKKMVYIGNGEFTYVQYIKARSNPAKHDTDEDGINDYIDKTPWHAYCGGNNYSKVSSHNELKYNEDNQSYVCSKCGYEFSAPEKEDKKILASSDYRNMVALSNMLVHYTLERVSKYGEESNLCLNEKLIINAMYEIRYQYNGRYSYSDDKGNCISALCEINNNEAKVYLNSIEVTSLNAAFYNGVIINTLGMLFGFANMKELSVITSLIGIGIDDKLTYEDILSIGNIMLNSYGNLIMNKKINNISSIASSAFLAYDYITSDVKKGDIEIRICLHRKGYGRSAEQSVGTFVFDDNNKIKYLEYAEYGYSNEVKLE